MKPNITFFGEKLKSKVGTSLQHDKAKGVDLFIVVGTSLKVAPISTVLDWFDESIPRVLCNCETVGVRFDLQLLGHCDEIFRYLLKALGWERDLIGAESALLPCSSPQKWKDGAYLFPGAAKNLVDDDVVASGVTEIAPVAHICDACGSKISNGDPRHTCVACFDFDLCGKCATTGGEDAHRSTFESAAEGALHVLRVA